jgi:hypothetical protein
MRRVALCIAFVACVLGCNESAEQSTFVVNVSQINNGSPLLADVVSCEDDTTCGIPTDVVPAEFTNRIVSPNVVDPGTAWYDFHLRSYSVRFRRNDGGPISGPGWNLSDFNHTGATSAIIPANGSAEVGVLVVPVGMKSSTPFFELQLGGVINLIADIDFVGSSAIDLDDEIHVPVSLTVSVANFADN